VENGERAARPQPDPAESREKRASRTRYRVDSAYRTFQYEAARQPSQQTGAATARMRRISSADLLASMIHQMGGGATSNTKGMFVDIAI